MTKMSSHEAGHHIVDGGGPADFAASSSSTLVVSSHISAITIGSGSVADIVDIVSGGFISAGTEVYSGGIVNVSHGGSAYMMAINSGAEINVSSGGHVGRLYVSGGAGAEIGPHAYVSAMVLYGSATATDAHLMGTTYVEAGNLLITDSSFVSAAVISSTTLLTGGSQMGECVVVENEMTVENATVSSGLTEGPGTLNIESGGYVTSFYAYLDGVVNVDSGGHASDMYATFNGTINVDSGAVVSTLFVSYSSVAYDSAVSGESVYVRDGGVADNVKVWADKGVFIEKGGYISNMMLYSGAVADVAAGGTELDTEVAAGGIDVIAQGAVVSGLLLTNDAAVKLSDLVYGAGGKVDFDATTDILTVTEGSATEQVHLSADEGSYVYVLTDDGGSVLVTAYDHVTVVTSGQTVTDLAIGSQGETAHLAMLGGGSAYDLTVTDQGTITVGRGAYLSASIVKSGGVIMDGGKTSYDTVAAGGDQIVTGKGVSYYDGIEAGGTILISGGVANWDDVAGHMVVASTGSARATIIENQGLVTVEAGGLAAAVWVDGGGTIDIMSGANVTSVSAWTGGTVELSAGATLAYAVMSSGTVVLDRGAVLGDIYMREGVTVDLRGLAYVTGASASFDTATDQLIVTAGGVSQTVQFAGSYGANIAVSAAADGYGGVAIYVASGVLSGAVHDIAPLQPALGHAAVGNGDLYNHMPAMGMSQDMLAVVWSETHPHVK